MAPTEKPAEIKTAEKTEAADPKKDLNILTNSVQPLKDFKTKFKNHLEGTARDTFEITDTKGDTNYRHKFTFHDDGNVSIVKTIEKNGESSEIKATVPFMRLENNQVLNMHDVGEIFQNWMEEKTPVKKDEDEASQDHQKGKSRPTKKPKKNAETSQKTPKEHSPSIVHGIDLSKVEKSETPCKIPAGYIAASGVKGALTPDVAKMSMILKGLKNSDGKYVFELDKYLPGMDMHKSASLSKFGDLTKPISINGIDYVFATQVHKHTETIERDDPKTGKKGGMLFQSLMQKHHSNHDKVEAEISFLTNNHRGVTVFAKPKKESA